MRSSWPVLVSGEQLKTAFALDAVLNEIMFVTGPLILSGLMAFASPNAAVVFAACSTTAGVLLLLTVGARERKGRPGPQLALYHAASAALLLVSAQVSHLVRAGLVLLLVGMVGGPRDTLHQVVLGEAAPRPRARSSGKSFRRAAS
ncbi:hypothetical protein [Streptomyces sp. BRA346]|uniref:hypothetical protein n=1 Tax=Streptomyces sp. BRA346 TaxID=2878199 RepID=UPI004062C823